MTMKWSFSYNSFVKLSLYELLIIQPIPMDARHSFIKGVHGISVFHKRR